MVVKNIRSIYEQKKKYCLLIIFTLMCWFLLGAGVSTILISLIISYLIVRHLIHGAIFDSKVFISIIAVFFYIIFLQCVTLGVWLFNRNFPLDDTVYVCLAVLLLSYVYMQSVNVRLYRTNLKIFTLADTVSLLVGVTILTGIFIMPVIKGGFSLPTMSLSSINASIDDGHHIEFINDRLQFNRGVLFQSDAADSVRNEGVISSYPAGWHSANAVIIKTFMPHIKTGAQSITAYVVTKIFWYFILLFIFVRVTCTIYQLFSRGGKIANLSTTIWLSVSSFLFSFFFLIAPFRQGFYSFIPQLIAVLLLGLALSQIANSIRTPSLYQRSLALSLFLCIGGGLSWVLMLPAMGIAVIILVILYCYHTGISKALGDTISSLKGYLPLYILLLTALIVQFYVMGKSASTIPFVEHVSTQGPIEVYSEIFYAFIAVGLVVGGCLVARSTPLYVKSFLALLFSTFLIAAIIGLIQFVRLYDYSYYYFKALNVFTITAIPLSLAGYGLLIKRYTTTNGVFVSTAISGLLILFVVQVVGPNPGYPNGLIGWNVHGQSAREEIDYVKGNRVMSYPTMNKVWHTLHDEEFNYSRDRVVLFYNPGEVSQNQINTLLLKTNRKHSTCDDGIAHNIHKAATAFELLGYIKLFCKNSHVTIMTSLANVNELREAVSQRGVNKVNIKSSQ